MTDFKIDDEVRNKKIHKIKEIKPLSNGIYLNAVGWVDADLYELAPPKPAYPNAPHKHCAMICHVANGGVVREIAHIDSVNVLISHVSETSWFNFNIYEIVQPKTKDELRIDDLQNLIKLNIDTINEYKRELAELKPTVHY